MSEPGEGGVLYMAGPPGSLLATEPQGGWSLPLDFLYHCVQVLCQGGLAASTAEEQNWGERRFFSPVAISTNTVSL